LEADLVESQVYIIYSKAFLIQVKKIRLRLCSLELFQVL